MKKIIQILGDSISLGYGLNQNDDSYVDILRKNLADYQIDVFAECGRTIQDLERILPNLSMSEYNITIIFIGSNGVITTEEISRLIHKEQKQSGRIIVCTAPISTPNNNVIRNVVEREVLELCDLNKEWYITLFLPDNIHPNSLGHQKIADILLRQINTRKNGEI